MTSLNCWWGWIDTFWLRVFHVQDIHNIRVKSGQPADDRQTDGQTDRLKQETFSFRIIQITTCPENIKLVTILP